MKIKKRYKVLFTIMLILIVFIVWIVEPYSLNPFAKRQMYMVESETNFICQEFSEEASEIKRRADKKVNEALINNEFIGVSTGVYKLNCGSWIGTAGLKSKSKNERVGKSTLFRTASIAKPITAVAIMQLYEDKLINLDEPIQTYLPEFPTKPKGVITIRHLLNHTSGVKHYSSDLDVLSFTHYSNLVEALDEFKQEPLSFEPGKGYEYTTYGYTILGAIIEKVTGLSFQEYMKKNIFSPAGMKNTDIEESDKEYENKADLYIKLGSTYIKSPETDLSLKYPGGGFHTTAEDFLKFGQAIMSHTLIDSTSLSLMINTSSSHKEGTPYGFGWFIYEHESKGTVLMHGGSQSGTSTELNLMLDQGIVSVSLANNFGSNAGTQKLCFALSNLIYDISK